MTSTAAAVATPLSATPVSGAPGTPSEPFIRTAEPWDPADPPSTPPVVDLTAACVRPVPGGQFEAVFGYDNLGPTSVLVSLEADRGEVDGNVILRESATGVQSEDLGPQVTLFQPRRDRFAFGVRFEPHEQVAWQVHVPSQQGLFDGGGWKVTVRPRMEVPCGPNVPDHFAVVQHARFLLPAPTDIAVEPPGHIAYYEVATDVVGVRVACSTGGQVVDVRRVIGWQGGANLAPLDPDYRVKVKRTSGKQWFDMTTETVRPVADVFEDVILLGPIADVTARCAFGDEIVHSDEYWAESAGFAFVEPVIVDGAVVALESGARAPVGIRLR